MQAMFNMSIMQTYDQQQSYLPLVSSRINQFLANCVPAADQDLFHVINVIDFLTVDVHRFHFLAGNSAVIRSTFQPFSICNAFISSRSSTVSGTIISARVTTFLTWYH